MSTHDWVKPKLGQGCVVCGFLPENYRHTGVPDTVHPRPAAKSLDDLVKELESDHMHPAWGVRSVYSR